MNSDTQTTIEDMNIPWKEILMEKAEYFEKNNYEILFFKEISKRNLAVRMIDSYNEAKTLKEIIEGLKETIKGLKDSYPGLLGEFRGIGNVGISLKEKVILLHVSYVDWYFALPYTDYDIDAINALEILAKLCELDIRNKDIRTYNLSFNFRFYYLSNIIEIKFEEVKKELPSISENPIICVNDKIINSIHALSNANRLINEEVCAN